MWQGHLLSHKLSSKKVSKDRENKNDREREGEKRLKTKCFQG